MDTHAHKHAHKHT